MVQDQRTSAIFLFGDNMLREGRGGQAREMRGEINTIGVPTKWRPTRRATAYFSDADWDYIGVQLSVKSAFVSAQMFLDAGFDIVIPTDGLGTGLADLPHRAPRIHAAIEQLIKDLETYAQK